MRSRPKIIAATLRVIQTSGFGAVTIAAVAAEAKVSRQTVYVIFGSREQLVSQSVAEMVGEALNEIRTRLESYTNPGEAIVEMIVAGRSVVQANPVLLSMMRAGDGNPLQDEGMMEKAKAVALAFLPDSVTREPTITSILDEVVEMMTRLAISVAFFESDALRTDDDLRRFLRRWILPALAALT